MLPHEALREAARLIEAGWCQGDTVSTAAVNARDDAGRPVPLHVGAERASVNPEAVAFTAYGAIAVVMRRERVERVALVFDVLYRLALDATGVPLGGKNYVHPLLEFNEAEGRTQAEVLALLDVAAQECEKVGDGVFPSPIPLPSAEAMKGPVV